MPEVEVKFLFALAPFSRKIGKSGVSTLWIFLPIGHVVEVYLDIPELQQLVALDLLKQVHHRAPIGTRNTIRIFGNNLQLKRKGYVWYPCDIACS